MIPATPQSAGADSQPFSPGLVVGEGSSDGSRGNGAVAAPEIAGIETPHGRAVSATSAAINAVRSPSTGGVLPLASGGTTPTSVQVPADVDQTDAGGPPPPRPSTPFVEVRWCRACNKNRQHDLYGCAMRSYHRG